MDTYGANFVILPPQTIFKYVCISNLMKSNIWCIVQVLDYTHSQDVAVFDNQPYEKKAKSKLST